MSGESTFGAEASRGSASEDTAVSPLWLDDISRLGLVHAPEDWGCGETAVRISEYPGVQRFQSSPSATAHVLLVNDRRDYDVRWALLTWRSGGAGVPLSYEVLARGNGTGGSLREARHTYFGEDGYVFYVDAAALAWAFELLGRWFDF